MNLKKKINRLNHLVKNTNYIIFFMVYIVICSIMVTIFGILNTVLESDIMLRFQLGLPIIVQLILTYTVHRENQENRAIKFLFVIVFLYTLVCGVLSLYELYFTYPSFGDDLILYVSFAQIILQFILGVLLFICLIAKQVNKLVVIIPFIMTLFTIITLVISDIIYSDLSYWILEGTFYN